MLRPKATWQPAHGVTLHNTGTEPDARAARAEEEARINELVDTAYRQEFGRIRVVNGTFDPAYTALREGLKQATREVPSFINTNSPQAVGRALLDGWRAGAERYGKTGSAYERPEAGGRHLNAERPSAIAGQAPTHPTAGNFLQFLSAGARLQEFADGAAGVELFALVEIRQRASGDLQSVTLVHPSGLAEFDAWVVERAQTVGGSLTVDAGLTRALRSLWRFDGRLTYRRKLDQHVLTDPRATLGLLGTIALNALSGGRVPAAAGRFDEVTGVGDFVDLSNPQYQCDVTLLEAD